MKKVLKPPALRQGDTIGIFAPAGPLPNPEVLSQGCEIINNLGFKVKYSTDILAKNDYLAGDDKRRVTEFKGLLHDTEVKAMLALRGGYGSIRILAELDMEEIKKNPKIIIGFSDLTVLLNGIYKKTSMLTFHGPMLSTIVRDHNLSPCPLFQVLQKPKLDEITPANLKIVRKGNASGRVMGGNLTNLVHLLGTPYEPNWHNKILLLEDINEPAYKIDRMLTHLKLSGRLDKVSGIILGEFLSGNGEEIQDMPIVLRRILELTKSQTPIWSHFPISHGPENRLIPIGGRTVMDSESKTLFFPETCLHR